MSLRGVLEDAARGRFPVADGSVDVMSPPEGPAIAALVAFTGRFVVASPLPEAWVRQRLPAGDFLAPASPRFLAALGGSLDARDDGLDVVLAAPGLGGASALVEVALDSHPRVVRALGHRLDVRAFEAGPAVVIVGRGLALRTEVAIEVDPAARGRGAARAALVEARRLLPPDAVMFAQTAPGNAASLRALLAAGFVPLASEVLFFPDGRAPG